MVSTVHWFLQEDTNPPNLKSQLDELHPETSSGKRCPVYWYTSPESLPLVCQKHLMVLPTYMMKGCQEWFWNPRLWGLPPVCYDSGGNSEFILQGPNRVLPEKGDLAGMQKCIAQLLTDDKKRLFMVKMAENLS